LVWSAGLEEDALSELQSIVGVRTFGTLSIPVGCEAVWRDIDALSVNTHLTRAADAIWNTVASVVDVITAEAFIAVLLNEVVSLAVVAGIDARTIAENLSTLTAGEGISELQTLPLFNNISVISAA
jgi:hypothetical protein